jgi:hypothetical protein
VAYYLVSFAIAITWFIFALILAFNYKSIIAISPNQTQVYSSEPSAFDFFRVFLNIIMIVAIAMFGFSMINNDYMVFDNFLPFGIGLGIFIILGTVLYRYRPKSDQNTLISTLLLLEIVVFCVLLGVTALGWNFFYSDSELNTISGMSAIIVGFMYGYLSIRIILALNGFVLPPLHSIPIFRRIPRILMDMLILGLVIILLFGIGVTDINPKNHTSFLPYVPGFFLALIGFIIASYRFLKYFQK